MPSIPTAKTLPLKIAAGLILPTLVGAAWWLREAPPPTFSLPTLEGRQVSPADYRGKPLLLSFWASDCAPCLADIPHLVALYRELHPRGLELLAISMAYDPPNRVVELADRHQLPYPVALDLEAAAARAFQVRATPTTVLLDGRGRVTVRQVGPPDLRALSARIQAML